ncbi:MULTISPECIES: precorrin-3B C(17)-methyltransferase [Kamptonema]|uniref:precorrin-3B C(17)-methyltransferase n=1 Tax=Kamptonema TaxID=1501433 RepID=UPI0001DAC155|nr:MULTISPECIES: precorrin-3B C(17)-methyltransferase [Kamptonema]CBN57229.1 Precorrin-3 methyltransferase [Kamptonema sp. PCC 6506]
MNPVSPAIVILGQNSVPLARQIIAALPGSSLYGLADRTWDVDITFTNFGETLRELFAAGTPIIGICAAGILIRTLAPLITDKRYEPPVLAVAEDGSAVVPLLGGLHGVNELAREIATALGVQPAITTTGDIRFRTALLNPPQGYYLANPENAKTFISDLLAGATLQLDGIAPWLSDSKLPIASLGKLTVCVTEKAVVPKADCLVYHPATVAIALTSLSSIEPEIALAYVQQLLDDLGLAAASVAAIFAVKGNMGEPAMEAIAQKFKVPTRFFDPTELVEFPADINAPFPQAHREEKGIMAGRIALTAVGVGGRLVRCQEFGEMSGAIPAAGVAIAIASTPIYPDTIGHPRGQLAIVGTGPGGTQWMSPEVKEILREATDWVGYKFYLDLAGSQRQGQRRHDSDNREELDRARFALDLAAEGKSVAVVSSGDPGIFAMAAAVFEVLEREAKPEWEGLEIRVAPGISAMQAAAALIGAPLGHDFCVVSLSDILKPWSAIEQRIIAAAGADFAIALYNPVSKQRTWQLGKAKEILLKLRSPETPVVLGRNLGRPGQSVKVCTLDQFQPEDADMRTLVIIGSSQTRIIDRKYGGVWVYTPRRYSESVIVSD